MLFFMSQSTSASDRKSKAAELLAQAAELGGRLKIDSEAMIDLVITLEGQIHSQKLKRDFERSTGIKDVSRVKLNLGSHDSNACRFKFNKTLKAQGQKLKQPLKNLLKV